MKTILNLPDIVIDYIFELYQYHEKKSLKNYLYSI